MYICNYMHIWCVYVCVCPFHPIKQPSLINFATEQKRLGIVDMGIHTSGFNHLSQLGDPTKP